MGFNRIGDGPPVDPSEGPEEKPPDKTEAQKARDEVIRKFVRMQINLGLYHSLTPKAIVAGLAKVIKGFDPKQGGSIINNILTPHMDKFSRLGEIKALALVREEIKKFKTEERDASDAAQMAAFDRFIDSGFNPSSEEDLLQLVSTAKFYKKKGNSSECFRLLDKAAANARLINQSDFLDKRPPSDDKRDLQMISIFANIRRELGCVGRREVLNHDFVRRAINTWKSMKPPPENLEDKINYCFYLVKEKWGAAAQIWLVVDLKDSPQKRRAVDLIFQDLGLSSANPLPECPEEHQKFCLIVESMIRGDRQKTLSAEQKELITKLPDSYPRKQRMLQGIENYGRRLELLREKWRQNQAEGGFASDSSDDSSSGEEGVPTGLLGRIFRTEMWEKDEILRLFR